MLNNYDKFINNDFLIEGYNIKDVDSKLNNIVNKTRDSLLKIKYKYYNIYTNDKAELLENGSYYAIMKFDPSVENEETQSLDQIVFLAQVKIKKTSVVKVKDDREEFDVNIFDYIIQGYSSSVAEKTDILNKYKNDIKLIKTNGFAFMNKINPNVSQNKIHGFYLFKNEEDIETMLYDKLKVEKTKFQGKILSSDEKQNPKVIGGVSSTRKSLTIYNEKTNKNNLIIYLQPSGDFKYSILNLQTNKIESIKKQDLQNKYTQYKGSDNNPIQLVTYLKNKIEEANKETDLKTKISLLNNYSNYILIIDQYIKEKNAKDTLLLIVESIVSKYEKIISIVKTNRDINKKVEYSNLVNELNKYFTYYADKFRTTNSEISILFNNLKNETDKLVSKNTKTK